MEEDFYSIHTTPPPPFYYYFDYLSIIYRFSSPFVLQQKIENFNVQSLIVELLLGNTL